MNLRSPVRRDSSHLAVPFIKTNLHAHAPGSLPARIAALPSWLLWLLLFAAVALGHLTLLRLPYYWDEGGYYIPAALDFYHHGWIIPQFTNAHPPLLNIVIGTTDHDHE